MGPRLRGNDVLSDMPAELFTQLKSIWVAGRQLSITRDGETPAVPAAGAKKPFTKSGADRRVTDKPMPGKKPHRKGEGSKD